MINKEKIKFGFIAILIYVFFVIRLAYIQNINEIALVISLMIFGYLFFKGVVLNKRYKNINFTLYLFSLCVIISSVINWYNLDGAILYILKILNIILFIEYAFERKQDILVSKVFFLISLIFSGLTILYDYKYPLAAWNNNLNFLIGSKFLVSYNALATIVFFIYSYNEKIKKKISYKIMMLCLICISFLISKEVNCSTTMVGLFFYIVILILSKKIKRKFLCNANFIIFSFIGSAILVLVLEKILKYNQMINYMVLNIFEKDLSLSGRTIIYEKYPLYLKGHLLFGYGFNSVYDLFKNSMEIYKNTYAFDSQNALLEYILYFGIIGSIVFLNFVKKCFKNIQNIDDIKLRKKICFIIALYIWILMGIVEITINPLFYVFIAFTFCCLKNEKNEKNKNTKECIK